MVSGCGLGMDTTTSLSTLGFSLTREQILESLKDNASSLSREIYSE